MTERRVPRRVERRAGKLTFEGSDEQRRDADLITNARLSVLQGWWNPFGRPGASGRS